MTNEVKLAAGATLITLRELMIAICAARPDGGQLLKTLETGQIRIVLDGPLGLLEFRRVLPDGDDEWLETMSVNLHDAATFGALLSLKLEHMPMTVTH
jgi:hypothetical protein